MKFRKNKMRFKKNKQAQESLPTDLIITVVIILMIVMGLFVMNIFSEKTIKKIDTNMKDIHAKRGLLTMLKTPAYGDVTFSDLLIKNYYEKKEEFGSYNASTISTCSIIKNFLEEYPQERTEGDMFDSRCFNIKATVDGNEILKYNQCQLTDDNQESIHYTHIPLHEDNVIELTLTTCSCAQDVNKRYFAPEFTCGSFFSS